MPTHLEIEAILERVKQSVREEHMAAGQMTLGRFIQALESCGDERPILFDTGSIPGAPDSYRGYYEQLAFGYDGPSSATVGIVLTMARNAMGRVFTGYKGGDFVMHENTLIWGGSYGTSLDGRMIVGIDESGDCVVIRTQSEDT